MRDLFVALRQVGAAAAICCVSFSPFAKAADAVPGFAPGREGEQLPPRKAEQAPAPQVRLPMPSVAVPEEFKQVKFTLGGFDISGITAYKPEDIRAMFQTYVGTEVSVADVYGFAQAITNKYRQDGYILSLAVVPRQDGKDGIAKIEVVEGYVAHIKFDGPESLAAELSTYFSKVTLDHPFQIRTLERAALLANDVPGVRARVFIQPSADGTAGVSDLLINIEKKSFSVGGEINNYLSAYLGPFSSSASLSLNDLLGKNEELYFQGLTGSSLDRLRVGVLGFTAGIGTSGLRVGAEGLLAEATPATLVADKSVIHSNQDRALFTPPDPGTRTKTAGYHVFVSYPLLRNRSETLVPTIGFESKIVDVNKLTIPGTASSVEVSPPGVVVPLTQDRIGMVYADVKYSFGWLFGGTSRFDGSVHKAIPGVYTAVLPKDESRTNASNNFVVFDGEFRYERPIRGPLSFRFALTGQYTPVPLPGPEEMAIGGRDYLRGYDQGEISGDSGVGGKVELAYALAPWAGGTMKPSVFAFADAGRVWNIEGAGVVTTPSAVRESNQTLSTTELRVLTRSSIGLGGTIEMGRFAIDGLMAQPLGRGPSAEILQGKSNGPRFFVNLRAAY